MSLPAGELHGPYAYLTAYSDGRSRTVYVPRRWPRSPSVQVEATQRSEALMVEISQINLELLGRRSLR